mmetsp:Transcript_25181/g.55770  ORF Transcript_25181/g.55770 Transcript_25181/m.55770 type:complete len:220 (+) Transcript_25181:2098-2757(+)
MHSAACVLICCLSCFCRSQNSSCLWKKTFPSARLAVIWSPECRTRTVTLHVSSKPQLSMIRIRFRSRTSSSTKTSTTATCSGATPAKSESNGVTEPLTRTPMTRHSPARSVSSAAATCCRSCSFRPADFLSFRGGPEEAAGVACPLRLPRLLKCARPAGRWLAWPRPKAFLPPPRPTALCRSRSTMDILPARLGPSATADLAPSQPCSFIEAWMRSAST